VNNTYSSTASDLGYAAFPSRSAAGYYTIAAPTVVAATTAAAATFVDGYRDRRSNERHPLHHVTLTSAGVQTSTTPQQFVLALVAERSGA